MKATVNKNDISIEDTVICDKQFATQTFVVHGYDNACKSATAYSF